ncbi:hypothetical protein SAMN04489712_117153 [Thermomonospora echinospora]|uniref:Uncharacterized protein n=1 Tax=Thermomonospora echinospora TaxID=1992 RepID=A0A1H6DI77_9ACTN|nr:hypothetical protein [Thermomonospora echinospora]SEG85167.1 hypothetical protein SAMN04489712_117153 [Thermomonospora echinospora]
MLPAEFAALEPYGDWILETERERYEKRLASSMEEMQAFYDAAFPLLESASKHLDAFTVGELPEPERNLLLLMFSLVMVSFPIEVWKQARVPDSGAAYLDLLVEPRV